MTISKFFKKTNFNVAYYLKQVLLVMKANFSFVLPNKWLDVVASQGHLSPTTFVFSDAIGSLIFELPQSKYVQ